MNSRLLEQLHGFQIPPPQPIPEGRYLVAHLRGVDFSGLFESKELGFQRPFDARFAKLVLRTASHLLGGDACGTCAFAAQTEFSVLLASPRVSEQWDDVAALQNYLVALASTRLSALVEAEAIFACRMFAFQSTDLVVSYFVWRQQEANVEALNAYCAFVLGQQNGSPQEVNKVLDGLGPVEKEEVLRQNNIEYATLPAWQRFGAAVHLLEEGRVAVETNLGQDGALEPYLRDHLRA